MPSKPQMTGQYQSFDPCCRCIGNGYAPPQKRQTNSHGGQATTQHPFCTSCTRLYTQSRFQLITSFFPPRTDSTSAWLTANKSGGACPGRLRDSTPGCARDRTPKAQRCRVALQPEEDGCWWRRMSAFAPGVLQPYAHFHPLAKLEIVALCFCLMPTYDVL